MPEIHLECQSGSKHRHAKLTEEIAAELRRDLPANPRKRSAWYAKQAKKHNCGSECIRRAAFGLTYSLRTWAIVDGQVVTVEGQP